MRNAEDLRATDSDEEAFAREIVRLNGVVLGLVLGIMAGLLVFVATLWLVIRGGEQVGPHLGLLGQFFYGYSVSFLGSVVGAAYGFVLGCFAGWSTSWIYNAIVDWRAR